MSSVRRLMVGLMTVATVIATAPAARSEPLAENRSADAEPATSYFAIGGPYVTTRVEAPPKYVFGSGVSGARISSTIFNTHGEYMGEFEVYAAHPLTTKTYPIGGEHGVGVEYSFNSGEFFADRGFVRVLELKTTRVDGLRAQAIAVTFDIWPEHSKVPVYGAFGYNTEIPLGVPNDTAADRYGDFDGNGSTDVAVFRPSTGQWRIRGHDPVRFGRAGDVPVPGDYDGDGRSDIAVFRPSTGQWLIRHRDPIAFGRAGDRPVPGDYDGDGYTDLALYRPSTGEWLIRGLPNVTYGRAHDVPEPGDYDGDGTTDVGFYRPSNRRWYLQDAKNVTFGVRGDVPAPGPWCWMGGEQNVREDGRSRVAVFHPADASWRVRNIGTLFYGKPHDVPVPGTYGYLNNSCQQPGVFRPADGTWRIDTQSGPTGQVVFHFGQHGDIPV